MGVFGLRMTPAAFPRRSHRLSSNLSPISSEVGVDAEEVLAKSLVGSTQSFLYRVEWWRLRRFAFSHFVTSLLVWRVDRRSHEFNKGDF